MLAIFVQQDLVNRACRSFAKSSLVFETRLLNARVLKERIVSLHGWRTLGDNTRHGSFARQQGRRLLLH